MTMAGEPLKTAEAKTIVMMAAVVMMMMVAVVMMMMAAVVMVVMVAVVMMTTSARQRGVSPAKTLPPAWRREADEVRHYPP
jgi:hypothetical protein